MMDDQQSLGTAALIEGGQFGVGIRSGDVTNQGILAFYGSAGHTASIHDPARSAIWAGSPDRGQCRSVRAGGTVIDLGIIVGDSGTAISLGSAANLVIWKTATV